MDEGAMADQFEVLEELGSGSFGVVYKGIEKSTGEIVAIKHIDLESSDDDIQDIQQEISVLSTCNSPFVTQYKASFLRGYKLWIIMEFLGGGSCLDLLRPGPFNEGHIATICRELLLGLDYLHQEGKIHRDIKAANILLAQSGKVKIADFGVAAQLTNIKSQRNTFVGTPFWMAPEVIQQAGYDFKADIWSLGVTAMEMIHGEPPNASTHPMKALFLIPKAPAPRLQGNSYSPAFKDFVAACLVKDPDRRPTAKELLQHRFIKNAGVIEDLQELVQRRQMWDCNRGKDSHPKFYEESMETMLKIQEKDSWVFDTMRAPTVLASTTVNMHTQKRRRVSTAKELSHDGSESLFGHLTLEESQRKQPLQPCNFRKATIREGRSLTAASGLARRTISGQKQALALSLDFGNSASTVRQFRRASNNSQSKSSNASGILQNENQQSIASPVTKEALLGRRAYSKAIDPAFQEARAQTVDKHRRELVSDLALAWDTLNKDDPEGVYVILRLVMQKLQRDEKLDLLPRVPQPNTPQNPKLMLAQSNPHLKSHRRRQSSIKVAEEAGLDKPSELPGQLVPGMDHTKQLADVLYSKWVDSLKNRWPNV